MLKKHSMLLFSVIFLMVVLVGCSIGSGKSGGETLADHDITLPDGIESKLPLPKGSTVTFDISDEDIHGVTFKPGANYPDTIEFFSESFAASDWDVEKEDIPEEAEGERTANWRLWADGYSVELSLTAFGDEKGFNMSGVYSVSESAESMKGVEYDSRNLEYNRISYEGENMDIPEKLPDDIPLIEGASIFRIETYDEETEPEGQGHVEVVYEVEGIFEDVVDYYAEKLAEIGFDEEKDGSHNPEVGSFSLYRDDEELYLSVRQDFEEDGFIGVSISHWDERRPEF